MKNFKNLIEFVKKRPNIIIAAGLCGIAFIFLWDFLNIGRAEPREVPQTSSKTQQFKDDIEESLRNQIERVVGGEVSVMVTLRSGVEYVFASEARRDERSVEDGSRDNTQLDRRSEQRVILHRDENGNEVPLVITEIMPTIKGVVVAATNVDEETAVGIKNIVTTALNISENRVYVVRVNQ